MTVSPLLDPEIPWSARRAMVLRYFDDSRRRRTRATEIQRQFDEETAHLIPPIDNGATEIRVPWESYRRWYLLHAEFLLALDQPGVVFTSDPTVLYLRAAKLVPDYTLTGHAFTVSHLAVEFHTEGRSVGSLA